MNEKIAILYLTSALVLGAFPNMNLKFPIAIDDINKCIEMAAAQPVAANIYTELIDNLTDYEKELICRIAVRECIDQDVPGQRAVIEVILNRVISNEWPNTVEGVLSQGSKTGVLQFATWPIKHWAKDNEIAAMMETLELVRTSTDLILPSTDYVYFATKEQTYAKNYFAIQDHHFGTGLNSSFDLEEWLKHNELTN